MEDDRPKVTMTKNELMRLLGIESLMKRNSKTKLYETMMDLICEFLIIQKEMTGGVEVATSNMSDSVTTASSSSTIAKVVEREPAPKRVASVL